VRNRTGLQGISAIVLAGLVALAALATLVASPACANGVLGDFGLPDGAVDDAGGGASTIPDAAAPVVDAGTPPPVVDSGHDPGTGPGVDTGTDSAPPPPPTTVVDAGAPPTTGGVYDAGSDDSGPSVLIGKWTFDEGTGTSSADLSGGGHPAVLAGGASWSDAGKEGSGLALNGTTAYADVGASLVDTTKSFSVLGWTKLTVVSSWEILASQDDVEGSLFGLKLRADTNDFDFDVETSDVLNPGFVVAQSTTAGVAATWVHLAGVYNASNGGTLKIYVNGTLQANAAVGQAILPSTGHFVIGRGLYNGVMGSFLNGTLDELEVFSGALTDTEVQTIYGAQE
jgi:hypothetical protein